MFTRLESLHYLTLNNNGITSIANGAFSRQNNLKVLSVDFNNLAQLSDSMVHLSVGCLEINLKINSLDTISCKSFAKIRRFVNLDIGENLLNCNKYLCWLEQEVETGSIKWKEDRLTSKGFPLYFHKLICANGANWDNVTWTCHPREHIK